MFKVVISLMFMASSFVGLLFAPCINNATGKKHAKTIVVGEQKTQEYKCLIKSPAFYKNKKIRLSFYKNNKCVMCGCSGEMHTDGVPFEQKRKSGSYLEGLDRMPLPSTP